MGKARPALLLLALFASAAAFAQSPSVAYVEGPVQRRAGESWAGLEPGQVLETSATLRLGTGGLVELAGGGRSLLLSKPGTYELSRLWNAAPERAGAAARLLRLVERSGAGRGSTSTAVAGVRGDSAAGTAALGAGILPWMEDEAEALLESAALAESQGRHEDAAAYYLDALRAIRGREPADEGAASRAAYAAGLAYLRSASLGAALEVLRSADPAAAGELRADYALLLAALWAQAGDREAARRLLDRAAAESWLSPETRARAEELAAGLEP